MELRDYQRIAQETDRVRGNTGDAISVPLFGLAGEVGTLLAEYKKFLRDGDTHHLFREHVAEELGDILWYTANVATKFSLSLEDIADDNLAKTRSRWPTTGIPSLVFLFDEGFPANEQLPRRFTAVIHPSASAAKDKVTLLIDGKQTGDMLSDNAYISDGYRFHDVFHLGHAALLGWSPVVRSLTKRKRKSRPEVDEVEDGGRAIVIDEALVALEWDYARKHNFLEGTDHIDYPFLATIRSMTSGLEVGSRSAAEWEMAILKSFEVWRAVKESNGGVIQVDLLNRVFEFAGPAQSTVAASEAKPA